MTITQTSLIEAGREWPAHGWVLYDGECPLCINAALKLGPWLRRHHFQLTPLQTPWVRQRLGLLPEEPLTEMKWLAADGRVFGGADALVQIARMIWWTWPLFALAQIPGTMILLRKVYRRIAAGRTCSNKQCAVMTRTRHHGTTTFLEEP